VFKTVKETITNQQGNVLIIMTSMVLVVIVIIGGSYLYLSSASRIGSTLHYERIKAYYIAEAGIEMAIDELLKGEDGDIPNTAFASGDVKVESEKINNISDEKGNNIYKIISTGEFQAAKTKLELIIDVTDVVESSSQYIIDGDLNIFNNNSSKYAGGDLYVDGDVTISTGITLDSIYTDGDVKIISTGVTIRTGIITGSLTDTGNSNDVTINSGLPPRELIEEPNNNFKTNIISWKKIYD